MPILKVDSEAAELAVVGIEMLQAALSARVRRADPQGLISDSLQLQANKLESVVAQMLAPEPPEWDEMSEAAQKRAVLLALNFASNKSPGHRAALFGMLREMLTASDLEHAPLALDPPLEDAASANHR